MLALELAAPALAPQFARATREYLFAIMVWPGFGQPDQRAEFLETCGVARRIDEAKAVPGTFRIEMLDQVFTVRRMAEFEEEVSRRVLEGAIVGEYYATAIEQDRVGVPVSLKQLKAFLTRPERHRGHRAAKISEAQLRDLLREYRPAAHMWAALFMQTVSKLDAGLPCSPDRIGDFLAVSELLANRLTAIRLERRNKPLIGSDLWRVPPSLAAMLPPAGWVDFRPEGWPPLPHDLFKLYELVCSRPD